MNEEIEKLKLELSDAKKLVREIQDKLNQLRVKCPTCRCRILPGEECSCCVSAKISQAISEKDPLF